VKRPRRCGLPLASLNSVGTPDDLISRLNGWPTDSPVNASTASSRRPPHDSGSGWFAIPFLYRTFIDYSSSVLMSHQAPNEVILIRLLRKPTIVSTKQDRWTHETISKDRQRLDVADTTGRIQGEGSRGVHRSGRVDGRGGIGPRAERESAATLGAGEKVNWSHAHVGNESAAAGIPGTALGNTEAQPPPCARAAIRPWPE
jgi:hypothetical protein